MEKQEENMGKVVITVENKHYIIDDETGDIKEVIIQDKQDIPIEDMKSIIKFLANQNKDK
jgi:hypothetical protein